MLLIILISYFITKYVANPIYDEMLLLLFKHLLVVMLLNEVWYGMVIFYLTYWNRCNLKKHIMYKGCMSGDYT